MITKLSKESSLPSTSETWSARLQQRYRFRLSPELADWFDSGIWKQSGHNEFHLPVDPGTLLEDAPEAIWPALMPCDLLPLIGNDAGDWLCIRVSDDSTASEIVQWYHGGGDWIPWGNSIAEAIVFDALRQHLPGPKRSHATPAEPHNANRKSDSAKDPIVDWAASYLPKEAAALLKKSSTPHVIAEVLLDTGICEVAVRCTLVEDALHEPLSGILDHSVAEELEIDWNRAVEWMFDTTRVPDESRRRLTEDYDISLDESQNWELAAQHCRKVTRLAPSLAWAWDILGYSFERSGNYEKAIAAYIRGAQTSVFTDQSVRLRTHWSVSESSKFSAARLLHVAPAIVQNSTYLRMICEGPADERRRQIASHWLAESDQATANGDVGLAHENLVRAGWDLGAEPISAYADILQRIAEAAVQADRAAQAELADTHRVCLRERFGI